MNLLGSDFYGGGLSLFGAQDQLIVRRRFNRNKKT